MIKKFQPKGEDEYINRVNKGIIEEAYDFMVCNIANWYISTDGVVYYP